MDDGPNCDLHGSPQEPYCMDCVQELFNEIQGLRDEIERMRDEWFSPTHVAAVEERTIQPLRDEIEGWHRLAREVLRELKSPAFIGQDVFGLEVMQQLDHAVRKLPTKGNDKIDEVGEDGFSPARISP